jgi:hypothetical protein
MTLKLEPHDRTRLLSALEEFRKIIELSDSRRSCTTCLHLRQGLCERWQAKPPLDVLKIGCDEWVFDAESPPF